MSVAVHDQLLVGYSVDSETARLSLDIRPHNSPLAEASVAIFEGVVAHHFITPLLPAILDGIYPTSAEDLLKSEWSQIQEGYALAGWPGPWAETLPKAVAFALLSSLVGYRVQSSYGLSGWVLAKSLTVHASQNDV